MAVITDRKRGFKIPTSGIQYAYYRPAVLSATDYYAFGMEMPGRAYSAGAYRYGFNGKENDRSNFGLQLVQDYGMRLYNPALGKFLSVDSIAREYPELTPYQFASNTPIQAIDLDGLEAASINKQNILGMEIVLSVRTEGIISASQYDARGLTKIGQQRNTDIQVRQQQAVAAKRPVLKADKRSASEIQQGAVAMRQMETQKQMDKRQELDPVAYGIGRQLADPQTWIATASVVVPQIAASYLPAIPTIGINLNNQVLSVGITTESLAGASSDVVAQMSNSLIQGKSFSESMGDVNLINTAGELLLQGKLAPAASGVLGSFASFTINEKFKTESLGRGLRNSAINIAGNYIGETYSVFKVPQAKVWRFGSAFGTNLTGDNTANAVQNAFDKNEKP